jgi:2-C-methyl-D-erythritol 4-phosphate cytidylyltransferase
MPSVGVVIAAGGKGVRLGGRLPKQFLRIGNRSLLEHTLMVFHRMKQVRDIVVVVPALSRDRVERTVRRMRLRKVVAVVSGGRERQESVWNGLQAFPVPPDIVLIHDAVRPCIRQKTIQEVILRSMHHRAAVVGVRVKDTIKVEETPGFYSKTLDRKGLWAVQTPQGFAFELLVEGHRRAHRDRYIATDDASLVERLGIPVAIVEGEYRNIKVTTRDDLEIARKWLKPGR